MKTKLQILLQIGLLFTVTFINAQGNTKQNKKKSHIVIVTNENGKETKIDTTFTDEATMQAYLDDNGIDSPPTPPVPPSPPAPPMPSTPPMPQSSKRVEKKEVYTYKYKYNDENDDENEIVISFKEKDFKNLMEQLESTIKELEQNKNISQKEIQKELKELKLELDKIQSETHSSQKTTKTIIIKKDDKE